MIHSRSWQPKERHSRVYACGSTPTTRTVPRISVARTISSGPSGLPAVPGRRGSMSCSTSTTATSGPTRRSSVSPAPGQSWTRAISPAPSRTTRSWSCAASPTRGSRSPTSRSATRSPTGCSGPSAARPATSSRRGDSRTWTQTSADDNSTPSPAFSQQEHGPSVPSHRIPGSSSTSTSAGRQTSTAAGSMRSPHAESTST